MQAVHEDSVGMRSRVTNRKRDTRGRSVADPGRMEGLSRERGRKRAKTSYRSSRSRRETMGQVNGDASNLEDEQERYKPEGGDPSSLGSIGVNSLCDTSNTTRKVEGIFRNHYRFSDLSREYVYANCLKTFINRSSYVRDLLRSDETACIFMPR